MTPKPDNDRQSSPAESVIDLTRLAALVDHAHDAVFVRNLDGQILYWNKGAERVYGWTSAEAEGQIAHMLLKTCFPKPLVVIEEALRERGEWEGRLVHTDRNGRPMTVESRWALDMSGGIATILEINRDITPRLETQEALRARERQLRFITDNAPVAIAHCDTNNRFKFVNKPYATRVFGMFTQVEQSRDQAYGGLGIGLTLVRFLVELHGGTVTAHSEGIDRGSTFVVRLPRVVAGPDDTKVPRVKRPEGVVRKRVLIVDDNVDAAESLQMWLEMAGHEVTVAIDGPRALAVVESAQPDVVLLDLGMPGMNGFEVARRIRAASWGRKIVLVALTGWGQEEDRRQTREAGFDHHLTKPVPPDDIEELIRRL